MVQQNSLADDVLVTFSEVRRIGENMDDKHPLRHSVRDMKRLAESIIGDAMRQAISIADQAGRLVKDYDDSLKQK